MKKTTIIAEAGVNHNGSLKLAKKLIDAGAEAGVDYVKFQTFKAEKLVTKSAQKADYQARNIGDGDNSQFAMLKKLELSEADHFELVRYCDQKGVKFLSTAFDLDSLEFLTPLIDFWKVPSGEITNYPYLRAIGETQKPVVLSTGMATIAEVADAINTLKKFGTTDIKLLHCTTEYPAPKDEINLAAMQTMHTAFGLEIGYSDHTVGIEIPVAAASMGAAIIEKHFTLDRNMEGPDHKASLEPTELKQMVDYIRNVEKAIGDGDKKPSESESKNISIARKSIIAARPIKQGEVLTEENLTTKRPANGISPMEWENVIGKVAISDFAEEEAIKL